MMRSSKVFWVSAAVIWLAVWASVARAATPVCVVVQPGAPQLEKFAAAELCGYLDKLFAVRVMPADLPNTTATEVIIVGSRAAQLAAVKSGKTLSDQGILLRSSDAGGVTTLIVGGGTPRATLWAVYDLAERWGVRFLLHEDVVPAPRRFEMPRLDVVEEPNLRVRQWRVLNEHAMGPIGWGIADYRPVIDQLAKLRFNRLLLYIWPGQPFLPLQYKGITQTSGTLFFGHRFPITDDMVGRGLFGAEKEFWNPDLPTPGGDPAALTQAAVRHVRAIIDYARTRGMECVVPASLLEFPREFRPAIAHTQPVDMIGTPTIGPGADADIDNPTLTDLARTVLRTTLRTYPNVDYIALDVPEWRAWFGQYSRAWAKLDAKYHVGRVESLDDILAAARRRENYPGGAERAIREVQADIVALYFFDRIISEPEFAAAHKKFVISSMSEELYPILPRIFPPGSETLNFVDYTPSRIVRRRNVLKNIPARQIPSVLVFTLHDDNIGVLPQLTTHSLAKLTDDIRAEGWAGFSTRYWLTGDHDPCVAYLARAAWDADASVESVYRDQILHVNGAATIDSMLTVYREVEAATELLEWHGLGLSFPTPAMMMQHWTSEPLTPELAAVTAHYEVARSAAAAAVEKSSPAGRKFARYWVGRLTFGIDYMNAIAAVRAAATAQSHGNAAEALASARRALDLITHGITAYAGVARDRSDTGAIATMNEFVVRPLRAKLASLKQSPGGPSAAAAALSIRAVGFQKFKVYQSKQRPSYTSWASFFPGLRHGEWYIGCAEITRTDKPVERASPQWVYEMSLPRGYDTSKFRQELVLLKSTDSMTSWNVVSRETVTANGGSFGQAITPDGTLHRFVWACYSRDPKTKTSDIYQISRDEGKTWIAGPTFVSDRFAWYPHRLRALRDGTLVLCCARGAKWGKGTDHPIRAATSLDVVSDMEMMLYISRDRGKTWSNPLPIFSGQSVSETDFVELRDGNLLFFNNSIFDSPGRQFVFRDGDRFTPGPLERVHSGTVPETVCLTDNGLLVGCMRPGKYYYSDDLGQNWHELPGAPATIEVYQPWIQYLGNGQIACAGHYGADDPIGGRDQSIDLHRFSIVGASARAQTKLWIERRFDKRDKRFLNVYAISLTANGKPIADGAIDVWYVARGQPGYESFNLHSLEARMKLGGKRATIRTGNDGVAILTLPEFDRISDINSSYQLVVRFNPDNFDSRYASASLPQLEYYANSGIDP